MKHLYIFSTDTNYGEFVKACVASSDEEAAELCDLKNFAWRKDDETPKTKVRVDDSEECRLVFDGGGDSG